MAVFLEIMTGVIAYPQVLLLLTELQPPNRKK